jgi:hypothetical protein
MYLNGVCDDLYQKIARKIKGVYTETRLGILVWIKGLV